MEQAQLIENIKTIRGIKNARIDHVAVGELHLSLQYRLLYRIVPCLQHLVDKKIGSKIAEYFLEEQKVLRQKLKTLENTAPSSKG